MSTEKQRASARRRYLRSRPKILARHRQWRLDHPQQNKEIIKRWQKKNPDKVRAQQKRYTETHRAEKAERHLRWRLQNPEKHRQSHRNWTARNRDWTKAKDAYRRAGKLNATPPWVDLSAIKEIYKHATACGLQVDHIIPLKHAKVCGLHVPWNLQLLSKSANSSKSNRVEL